MDANKMQRKIQQCNNLISQHSAICKAVTYGKAAYALTHAILFVPFVAAFLLMMVGKDAPVIAHILGGLVGFSADTMPRFPLALLSLGIIFFSAPLLGLLVYHRTNKAAYESENQPIGGTFEEMICALSDRYKQEECHGVEEPYCRILIAQFSAYAVFLALGGCGLTASASNISSPILRYLLSFILVLFPMAFLCAIAFFVRLRIDEIILKWIFDSKETKGFKYILEAENILNDLQLQFQREKQEAAAEKARQEKEQRAIEAECEFTMLEDPASDETTVQRLADAGSPSAGLCMGRILYKRYQNDLLTKREKTALANSAIKYLKPSADQGNTEAQFLSLYLEAYKEGHYRSAFEDYLRTARTIKVSGKLPANYSNTIDNLIGSLISTIDNFGASSSATYDHYTPTPVFDPTPSTPPEDVGVTGWATNAGMPYIDITGM